MSPRSILIIEDDKDIVELVRYNLEKERFQVRTTGTGEDGIELARTVLPSLILLDLGLPGVQGLEVCRMLKQQPLTAVIPIVMLTARGEESDVVLGLELGADDYIPKPFKIRELVARVRAVLRRVESGRTEHRRRVQVGEVVIDTDSHEILIRGEPVEFTLAEFRLLRALASQPGRVLTREQLLTEITEGTAFIIDRNVDVHVRAVRKKLGGLRDMISTVRGVGYKLSEPPRAGSS
jgi:DNA-binding response OmpR family regulator